MAGANLHPVPSSWEAFLLRCFPYFSVSSKNPLRVELALRRNCSEDLPEPGCELADVALTTGCMSTGRTSSYQSSTVLPSTLVIHSSLGSVKSKLAVAKQASPRGGRHPPGPRPEQEEGWAERRAESSQGLYLRPCPEASAPAQVTPKPDTNSPIRDALGQHAKATFRIFPWSETPGPTETLCMFSALKKTRNSADPTSQPPHPWEPGCCFPWALFCSRGRETRAVMRCTCTARTFWEGQEHTVLITTLSGEMELGWEDPDFNLCSSCTRNQKWMPGRRARCGPHTL